MNKSGLSKVIATKVGQDTILTDNYTCSKTSHGKGTDAENG
jgi:hypothetical protein